MTLAFRYIPCSIVACTQPRGNRRMRSAQRYLENLTIIVQTPGSYWRPNKLDHSSKRVAVASFDSLRRSSITKVRTREVISANQSSCSSLSAALYWSGNLTVNLEPLPSSLSTSIVPPCASTIHLEIASPNPNHVTLESRGSVRR